jgi:hypothetical protein
MLFAFAASPTCFKNPRNKGLVDCVVGQDIGPANGDADIRGSTSPIPSDYLYDIDPVMVSKYEPFLTYCTNIGTATAPSFSEMPITDQATSKDIMKVNNADGTTTALTGRNPSCADFDGPCPYI